MQSSLECPLLRILLILMKLYTKIFDNTSSKTKKIITCMYTEQDTCTQVINKTIQCQLIYTYLFQDFVQSKKKTEKKSTCISNK